MKFFHYLSVLDVDQRDAFIQIAQNVKPFRQRHSFDLDQILCAIFFTLDRLE